VLDQLPRHVHPHFIGPTAPCMCVYLTTLLSREGVAATPSTHVPITTSEPAQGRTRQQGELLAAPKDAVTLPQPALFSKQAQSRGPARLLDHQPSVETQASLHSPPFTVKPDPQKAKIAKTSMSTLGNMLLPITLQQ
jgi:hypothetical protein